MSGALGWLFRIKRGLRVWPHSDKSTVDDQCNRPPGHPSQGLAVRIIPNHAVQKYKKGIKISIIEPLCGISKHKTRPQITI